jgi:sigma-B regulation protein RsbU (phosphoserine phosphatase)
VFPTSSPIDRRLPWLKQLLLGLAVAGSIPLGLWSAVAGSLQPLVDLGDRLGAAGLIVLGLAFGTYGLGFVSLLWNMRSTSADVRRRTRVIVFGTVVGVGPAFLLVVVAVYLGRPPEALPLWVVTPCSLAVIVLWPLSFAYAVVRHRVLDVPQLLRLGLQYAFARRLLLSLVPLLAGLLVLDLVLHGDEPLLTIVRARGWVYGVLGGLALVTQTQRQRWLGTLDRTFFRERYDAQRLLGEVVDEVRQAGSFEQVAPRAVARLETALHAEFVAVLALGTSETSYRTVAAAPAGRSPWLPTASWPRCFRCSASR